MERVSLITEADYRNVVIFPEKFDGLYARLDRPHSEIAPWSIWISYSPDLRFWGESQLIMRPEPYHWDEMKIGPGAPPIKTDQGWLSIYHGVFQTMDGSVYRLGVALHDLRNPAKIIGVGDSWILQPEDPWEITGYVHNVVFTCGAVAEPDGTVKIYWGGADTVMCVGEANVSRSGRAMPGSRQTGEIGAPAFRSQAHQNGAGWAAFYAASWAPDLFPRYRVAPQARRAPVSAVNRPQCRPVCMTAPGIAHPRPETPRRGPNSFTWYCISHRCFHVMNPPSMEERAETRSGSSLSPELLYPGS